MLEVSRNQVSQAREFLGKYGVKVVAEHYFSSRCQLTVEGPETIPQPEGDVPLEWMTFVNVPDGKPLQWKNVFFPVTAGKKPQRHCIVHKKIGLFGYEETYPEYVWRGISA